VLSRNVVDSEVERWTKWGKYRLTGNKEFLFYSSSILFTFHQPYCADVAVRDKIYSFGGYNDQDPRVPMKVQVLETGKTPLKCG